MSNDWFEGVVDFPQPGFTESLLALTERRKLVARRKDGRPEQVFKDGAVEVGVFPQVITYEGKDITVRYYQVQRKYMDKEGDWKSTNRFGWRDLVRLSEMLNMIIRGENRKEG